LLQNYRNMKRLSILLFILFFAGLAHSQSPIVIGKTEEVYSQTLQEKRRIQVYLPASISDTYFYPRRYPVVYVLDGDSHFFTLSAIIKQLSEDGNGLFFPEMIVVAIGNTDRNRDLTPTRDTSETRMGRGADNHSGGGEKFLSFVEKELIPHVDSAYPTMPYRVFIGHSLGGLTVLNAFVHHNRLFNAYLAIDPSTFWDNASLLRSSKGALATSDYKGRSLFMAMANSLTNGLDTVSVMSDSSNLFSRHMRANFLIRDKLVEAAARGGFSFGWKYYSQYTHNSVPLVAQYDGLRRLFDFYRLDIQHEDIVNPSFAGDTLVAAHFADISRRMGCRVNPPEVFVNNTGYELMGRRQYERAFYYFRLNQQNYPNSFNVYDSMGDLYVARGDKKKAMENYAKALTLREYPETRQKLAKLQKEK
jgi:predicted alpha/beta superfamily hydrolase